MSIGWRVATKILVAENKNLTPWRVATQTFNVIVATRRISLLPNDSTNIKVATRLSILFQFIDLS